MADDDPPLHHAVLPENAGAGPLYHAHKGSHGPLGVVLRMGVPAGEIGGHVFEVRQPDIHRPRVGQGLHRLGPLVPSRVPHHRNGQTHAPGHAHRLAEQVGVMGG